MTPAEMAAAAATPEARRLWSGVVLNGDCWEYGAGRDKGNYGSLWVEGRAVRAHRFAYELVNGPIRDGLLVRHSCDNPPCVRPDHLLAGTDADNHRDRQVRGRTRGIIPGRAGEWQAAKTHCPKGHPYSGANLRIDGRGYRCCRTCEQALNRAARARRRAAA